MKLLLSVVLSYFFFLVSTAQITFQKTFDTGGDDEGHSVQQTSDGGYIIAGYSSGDAYLIKTDGNGDTLWTKTYGGGSGDQARVVQQTSDGGYMIAGNTLSFGAGFNDFYLIKTDSAGDTLWTKAYGGTDDDICYSGFQTSDGGYLLAGVTSNFGAGGYVVKTDAIGDTLWDKVYPYMYLSGVQPTFDGGYILVGFTSAVGVGLQDIYVIKTDSVGDILWTRTYGDNVFETASCIKQTPDSGYIIGGTDGNFGLDNYYLIRIDASGDTLWTKSYGGSDEDYILSVDVTTDGGFIFAGQTRSFGTFWADRVYLLKTDANGDTLWTKVYGTNSLDDDIGASVQQTTDGGYIIAGSTESFGATIADVYLIKTDSNGYSGCNEANPNTQIFNIPTSIGSGGLVVDSSGIVSNTATIIENPASIVSTLCTNVGLDESLLSNQQFIVYPNPASGTFTIEGNYTLPSVLEMYDITGRQVHRQLIANSRQLIAVSHLSKGMYVWSIGAVRGKLIVE